MKPFTITFLGTGSAVPTPSRNPSSQLVKIDDFHILIDCAEGTLMQLNRFNLSPMKLNYILISHLHGDHYHGLIGLITAMHLNGRTNPLRVAGPPGLYEIIQLQLKYADTTLRFPLIFITLTGDFPQVIIDETGFSTECFSMKHRIPAWGFLIREKIVHYKIRKESIEQYGLTHSEIHSVQKGEDVITKDGEIILNKLLTFPQPAARSYAYCSDTAFYPELASVIGSVNVLYHEATFSAMHAREAKATFHSTTWQAAEVARLAGAKRLVIGHFSSRYQNIEQLR
ncbi:MAG: ribonuclease Z, partial [Bacteroidales bacterium]|nr:ribonuclease Z [Bacteroidales bacterium]